MSWKEWLDTPDPEGITRREAIAVAFIVFPIAILGGVLFAWASH